MAHGINEDFVSLSLGNMERGDRLILEQLLDAAAGITGYEFHQDGTLVISLTPTIGEADLARILAATGIYPVNDPAGASPQGGTYVC